MRDAAAIAAMLGLPAACVVGCASRASLLTIDLVSDVVPGVEVFAVVTTIEPVGEPGMDVVPPITFATVPGSQLTRGVRIAEVDALPHGDYVAHVSLIGIAGMPITSRAVRVLAGGPLSIRVAIARDCAFVTCPETGDPHDATLCSRGFCIVPTCTNCMSPECQTDGDCAAPAAPCAAAVCASGVCLAVPIEGTCAANQTCNPELGCLVVVVNGPDPDGDGASGADDCAPNDPTIHRGGPEICGDGIDQDCDGHDLPCASDADGDGWGSDVDCDDASAAINPGADDICGNGIDEDCDGYDPPCGAPDLDMDAWSAPADCNDHDAIVHPFAVDICGDGIDQNCDGHDATQPCEGHYTQPCIPGYGCFSTSRQRLACVAPVHLHTRSCVRCCAICTNTSRFHWINVGHDCATAAARYCRSRGGLSTAPGVDAVQWGTCDR